MLRPSHGFGEPFPDLGTQNCNHVIRYRIDLETRCQAEVTAAKNADQPEAKPRRRCVKSINAMAQTQAVPRCPQRWPPCYVPPRNTLIDAFVQAYSHVQDKRIPPEVVRFGHGGIQETGWN